jgi:hypothetical protein
MFDQEGSRFARLRALGRVPSRQVATAEESALFAAAGLDERGSTLAW